jgi:hypothetical protein
LRFQTKTKKDFNLIESFGFLYCLKSQKLTKKSGKMSEKKLGFFFFFTSASNFGGSRPAGLGGDRDLTNSNNVILFVTNAKNILENLVTHFVILFCHEIAKL